MQLMSTTVLLLK